MRSAIVGARPRAGRELALLASLYVAYSAARLVTDPDTRTATGNSWSLLRLEGTLHVDVERWLNAALTATPVVALLASYWYSLLHYVVTPAVLVWVYRRRPGRYREARNALVIGSVLGIVGFALLPMAPPRMLPSYVDTLASTAGSGWWGGDASAPKGLGGLTNELAAMPSLHVGWAVWCAGVVLVCAGSRWAKTLAVGYAAGTTLVVIATANHFTLDAVGGILVIAVGWLVARSAATARMEHDDVPHLLRLHRQHLPLPYGGGGDARPAGDGRTRRPGGGRLRRDDVVARR